MKKIILLCVLSVAVAGPCLGQVTYRVDNFSDDYFGQVCKSDTTEFMSAGRVAIFDRKSGRELIAVEADELPFSLHDGELLANINELPYGEQSVILHGDYNFDGVKDFALMDGMHSGYHGPSFQIYLAVEGGFRHSVEFSRLGQEYLGMFDVDPDRKQLRTMAKSGCCWHEYSTFVVEDNRPVAVKIVEEGLSMSDLIWDYIEKNRVGGKMVAEEYSVFNTENEEKVIYSFEFSNGKKMRLIARPYGDRLLCFFTDKDDRVELFADWDTEFVYAEKEGSLSFGVGATTYTITSEGIVAATPKRRYDMKAVPGSRKGSLSRAADDRFENVRID